MKLKNVMKTFLIGNRRKMKIQKQKNQEKKA